MTLCMRRAMLAIALTVATASNAAPTTTTGPSAACIGADTELSLAHGFCATVFADHLGHPRHVVVAADGTVYINT